MNGRLTSAAIVGLWLSSMTWLVVAKVLPPLVVGEPPSYASVVEGRPQKLEWQILWDGDPVGQASSLVEHRGDLTSRLSSRVRLADLPLAKITPPWMAPLLGAQGAASATIDLEAHSHFQIDPLGQLIDFSSVLSLGSLRDVVSVQGTVDEGRLLVDFRCGEMHTSSEGYLPPAGIVSDAFSPLARLPKLRVGQRWTEPVYSPFPTSMAPLQILQATVERRETIDWNGMPQTTFLVVYRNDSGAKMGHDDSVRGRVWVHTNGAVLRQEAQVLNSRLTFVRVTPLGGETVDAADDAAAELEGGDGSTTGEEFAP